MFKMGIVKQWCLAVKSIWFQGANKKKQYEEHEIEQAYKTVHESYNTPEDQEYLDNTRKLANKK